MVVFVTFIGINVDVVNAIKVGKLVIIIGTSFSEISDSDDGSFKEVWDEDSKFFCPSSLTSSCISVELNSKSGKNVPGLMDPMGA